MAPQLINKRNSDQINENFKYKELIKIKRIQKFIKKILNMLENFSCKARSIHYNKRK